jgi:hypothetical protein
MCCALGHKKANDQLKLTESLVFALLIVCADPIACGKIESDRAATLHEVVNELPHLRLRDQPLNNLGSLNGERFAAHEMRQQRHSSRCLNRSSFLKMTLRDATKAHSCAIVEQATTG